MPSDKCRPLCPGLNVSIEPWKHISLIYVLIYKSIEEMHLKINHFENAVWNISIVLADLLISHELLHETGAVWWSVHSLLRFCGNWHKNMFRRVSRHIISLRPGDSYICVGNLTTIGADNGLSPGRRHAIIWTNAAILLIGPLWTNFSEILIEIPTFSFQKMRLKASSGKWRPFCLGLNMLFDFNE